MAPIPKPKNKSEAEAMQQLVLRLTPQIEAYAEATADLRRVQLQRADVLDQKAEGSGRMSGKTWPQRHTGMASSIENAWNERAAKKLSSELLSEAEKVENAAFTAYLDRRSALFEKLFLDEPVFRERIEKEIDVVYGENSSRDQSEPIISRDALTERGKRRFEAKMKEGKLAPEDALEIANLEILAGVRSEIKTSLRDEMHSKYILPVRTAAVERAFRQHTHVPVKQLKTALVKEYSATLEAIKNTPADKIKPVWDRRVDATFGPQVKRLMEKQEQALAAEEKKSLFSPLIDAVRRKFGILSDGLNDAVHKRNYPASQALEQLRGRALNHMLKQGALPAWAETATAALEEEIVRESGRKREEILPQKKSSWHEKQQQQPDPAASAAQAKTGDAGQEAFDKARAEALNAAYQPKQPSGYQAPVSGMPVAAGNNQKFIG